MNPHLVISESRANSEQLAGRGQENAPRWAFSVPGGHDDVGVRAVSVDPTPESRLKPCCYSNLRAFTGSSRAAK
jgi:hypothetical protein